MKTKQLLLGLILVNAVGFSVLFYSRHLQHLALVELAEAEKTAEGDGIQIPPRPSFEQPAEASAMQAEIAALRGLAFDIAELTVDRLPTDPAALCLLGKLHLRYGNLDGARLLWDQAMQLDRDFAEPYLDYGNLEIRIGNDQQAEQYFRTALEKDPTLIDAYTSLTEVLLTQQKFAQAVEQLRKLLGLRPESVQAWSRLGQAYQQLGEFENSIQCYLKALQIDANSREAAMGLMTAYRSHGDSANAAKAAELFAKIDAAFPRTAQDRDVVDRDREKMQDVLAFTVDVASQVLLQAGDSQTAMAQLELAHQAAPMSPEIRSKLASMYFTAGGYEPAIQLLRERCDQEPDNPMAWLELAEMCMNSRRLDAAETAIRRLIELVPDSAHAYALLAQSQMPVDRNPQAAVEFARRAVELSPIASNRYVLATAFYNAGDIEGTKAELRRAIELDPSNSEYRDALGRIE